MTATGARPRPARDVPPGTSWAFLDHRTVAEVWGIMELPQSTEIRRKRLPNRRHAITFMVEIANRPPLFVSLGVASAGDRFRASEIFINGGKEGSDELYVLQDFATAASVALQHGAELAALAKSLARVDGKPVTAIGAVLDAALVVEAQLSRPGGGS